MCIRKLKITLNSIDNEIGNIENEEENTMEENYDDDIKNFEKEDLSDDLMSKDDHDLSDEEENDNFATDDDNFELLAETTSKSEHIELINKVRTVFWYKQIEKKFMIKAKRLIHSKH